MVSGSYGIDDERKSEAIERMKHFAEKEEVAVYLRLRNSLIPSISAMYSKPASKQNLLLLNDLTGIDCNV